MRFKHSEFTLELELVFLFYFNQNMDNIPAYLWSKKQTELEHVCISDGTLKQLL